MRSGAKHSDSAGGVLDHGEDVQSGAGQGDDLEEVARQQRVGSRVNLAQTRVRTANQLHALRDLIPGGAPLQLSAAQAAAPQRWVRSPVRWSACASSWPGI